MPRIPPGIYPQACALNLANSGRRVSVSVTLPDDSTIDVQALALNNINATACQVFVDENGNATVSNPADTGRQLSQTVGRYVHRLPSPANPVLIPQPPTGIITWWSLDWVDNGNGIDFISGLVAADPVVPDDFYVYTKLGASGFAPRYFRYFAGITENASSTTLTVNATKITAEPTSQFGVQIYWNRGADVYPDPTPGSYSSGQLFEFYAQVPIFAFPSSNDGNFDASSTVSFTFSIPAGRTVIEVLESSVGDIAEPPVPSWTFSATLA